MKKLLTLILFVGATTAAHAGSNTIVSGTWVAGEIHIFDIPAGRLYKMMEASGAQKEDLGGCVELRNNTMACGLERGNYFCTISLKQGEVAKAVSPVCPRP